MILGIDPGTTQSGYVEMGDTGNVLASGTEDNHHILVRIANWPAKHPVVIEMIESRGMPVGESTFETCVWIGRMIGAYQGVKLIRIKRGDVKLHICGTKRAKDSNIRQALLDMYPAVGGGKTPQVGTRAQPGPLYGVTSHAWQALAVAVTARDQMEGKNA